MKAKKADDPPRTNSQQRYASSQRNRGKIGRNQLESQEIGNVDGKQQIESFFSRPAVKFSPVSQPPKRKPLLPLNLPNVPKKRAADPTAESKAKKNSNPTHSKTMTRLRRE